jgi:hypothetical protein
MGRQTGQNSLRRLFEIPRVASDLPVRPAVSLCSAWPLLAVFLQGRQARPPLASVAVVMKKLQGFSLCLAPGKQIDNFFVLTVQRPHGSVILPDTAKSLPAVLLRPSKSWESFRLGKDKTNLKAVSMSPRHVA